MIQPRQLLHRKRGPTPRVRTTNVHSRLKRDEIGHVRKRHESRVRHRVMAQAVWPYQPSKTQGDAIERSRHQSSDLQRVREIEGVCLMKHTYHAHFAIWHYT